MNIFGIFGKRIFSSLVKKTDKNEIEYYKNELEKTQKENFILKSELKDKENNIIELKKKNRRKKYSIRKNE